MWSRRYCVCHGVCMYTGQLSNTLVYSEFPVGLNTLELLVTTSAGNTASVSYVFYAPGYNCCCIRNAYSMWYSFKCVVFSTPNTKYALPSTLECHALSLDTICLYTANNSCAVHVLYCTWFWYNYYQLTTWWKILATVLYSSSECVITRQQMMHSVVSTVHFVGCIHVHLLCLASPYKVFTSHHSVPLLSPSYWPVFHQRYSWACGRISFCWVCS